MHDDMPYDPIQGQGLDIQSAMAEIRRGKGKKERKKERRRRNYRTKI